MEALNFSLLSCLDLALSGLVLLGRGTEKMTFEVQDNKITGLMNHPQIQKA